MASQSESPLVFQSQSRSTFSAGASSRDLLNLKCNRGTQLKLMITRKDINKMRKLWDCPHEIVLKDDFNAELRSKIEASKQEIGRVTKAQNEDSLTQNTRA
ncbi:conserved hypothetical protein [Ricinus communis]|uniref:Uncharacterized protein n=1 Tax=Ricinus communis TaxID=3988 RepID=B9SPF9_RICCO|nr:conserved hypothetical protein [Ricinus communis]